MSNSHIAIIGAGAVGASTAFSLVSQEVGSSITLVDINKAKMEGEVMDLQHGLFFSDSAHVHAGTLKDAGQCDIIIITAGAAQKEGETRLDLVAKNAAIMKSIFKGMGKLKKTAKILVISNPVDVLTCIAKKLSKLPEHQVFGSGTSLDTSRLRYYLGEYYGVNPKSVHAYIMGEHGDSEIAIYSVANIAGVPLKKHPKYNPKKLKEIYNKTKNAAYEIIKRKGATNFAIAMAATEIVEAILHDQNLILPVSVPMNTYYRKTYGIPKVCMGVPSVIGKNGIEKIINVPLSVEEGKKLKKSGDTLKKVLKSVGF